MDLLERIALMSDEEAVHHAKRVARGMLNTRQFFQDLPPGLREALQEELQVPTEEAGPPSEGVLARQALVLLAKDQPDELERNFAATEAEGAIAAITILTMALVILQTEVKAEKTADGRWTLQFHKRAASDGLLRSFLKSISQLSRLGK
jgi:hypothetical protein